MVALCKQEAPPFMNTQGRLLGSWLEGPLQDTSTSCGQCSLPQEVACCMQAGWAEPIMCHEDLSAESPIMPWPHHEDGVMDSANILSITTLISNIQRSL